MEALLQDVTLTAGFGLPSDAVALFGRPVPFLQLLHFAQVESSKCAPAGGRPWLFTLTLLFCCPGQHWVVTSSNVAVAWQQSPAERRSVDGDVHACVRRCALVHAFGSRGVSGVRWGPGACPTR